MPVSNAGIESLSRSAGKSVRAGFELTGVA